jgi:hypothetical protein
VALLEIPAYPRKCLACRCLVTTAFDPTRHNVSALLSFVVLITSWATFSCPRNMRYQFCEWKLELVRLVWGMCMCTISWIPLWFRHPQIKPRVGLLLSLRRDWGIFANSAVLFQHVIAEAILRALCVGECVVSHRLVPHLWLLSLTLTVCPYCDNAAEKSQSHLLKCGYSQEGAQLTVIMPQRRASHTCWSADIHKKVLNLLW